MTCKHLEHEQTSLHTYEGVFSRCALQKNGPEMFPGIFPFRSFAFKISALLLICKEYPCEVRSARNLWGYVDKATFESKLLRFVLKKSVYRYLNVVNVSFVYI